jgi:hypothetical protein
MEALMVSLGENQWMAKMLRKTIPKTGSTMLSLWALGFLAGSLTLSWT